MSGSTSNLSVDEQQAAAAAAKRKEEGGRRRSHGSGRRRYRAPRAGGSRRRRGCRTQDPERGTDARRRPRLGKGKDHRPSPETAARHCLRDHDSLGRRRLLRRRRLQPRRRPHRPPARAGCRSPEYTIGSHDRPETIVTRLQAVSRPRASHASSLRPRRPRPLRYR
jgi:hypothetical protein